MFRRNTEIDDVSIEVLDLVLERQDLWSRQTLLQARLYLPKTAVQSAQPILDEPFVQPWCVSKYWNDYHHGSDEHRDRSFHIVGDPRETGLEAKDHFCKNRLPPQRPDIPDRLASEIPRSAERFPVHLSLIHI